MKIALNASHNGVENTSHADFPRVCRLRDISNKNNGVPDFRHPVWVGEWLFED